MNGRVLLTHMGKYQARIAADAILGKEARVVSDGPGSPRVIFTDPQVAAVGHTLQSAQEAGLDVRAVDVATSGNAGASFYGRDAPGTVRLVVDESRGVFVGATFTGTEIADFLHAATVAVVGEVPLERLAHAVPSFPDAQRGVAEPAGRPGALTGLRVAYGRPCGARGRCAAAGGQLTRAGGPDRVRRVGGGPDGPSRDRARRGGGADPARVRAEAHGGEIWIPDSPFGARVRFSIPRATADPAAG